MTSTLIALATGAFSVESLDGAAGKALFDRVWIPAPASTDAADGLGPLFAARSCATCHRGGGSARLRPDGSDIVGAVVRFGAADGSADPRLGRQLQSDAVPGMEPEGAARFLPSLSFVLTNGALATGISAGARLAPALFYRARFDEVTDAEILLREDPDDRDGDGVSGRARRVAGSVGRFGWKAAHASLREQIADAFVLDLGLSSPLAPRPYGDCTAVQAACLAAPNGESANFDGREISLSMIDLLAAYLRRLTFKPAARPPDGARVFEAAGCAACHTPQLTTRTGEKLDAFSDLLLHDMGAELDDGVGEPVVASSEWRTAPLIGVAGGGAERRLLHDGSARTIEEAVARHGGEGAGSRAKFNALSAGDRRRLIDYVMGL